MAEEIRNEHAWYEILARAGLAGIAIVQGGRIAFGNHMLSEIFGYSREAIVGMEIAELIDGETRTAFSQALSHTGEPFEANGLRQDGSKVSVEVMRKVVQLDDRKEETVIFQDITKFKHVERELLRSEREYKKLFKDSKDGIYISSRDGHIVDANQATLDLFGYSMDQLRHLHSEKLYADPTDRLLFQQEIEKYGAVRDFAVSLKRKDGSVIDCLLTSSVRLGHDGTVVGYQGIIHDITSLKRTQELKRAKELAEQSEKLKAQFLANMSHEVRTPMNAVFGMTNLLLQTSLDASQREYVEFIKDSSEHLLVLVNDILDFSKIDAGKLEITEENFDLHDLINNLVTTLRFKVMQRDVTLNLDIGDVPEVLRGDEVRLNQVLLNLLSNAVKFTEEGEIMLSARVLEKNEAAVKVSFQVRDTGIGIPKDKLEAVFGSFTQVMHGGHRKYQGTGLGLAITRRLVELMGGKITVESQVGKGTVFKVLLSFKHASGDVPRPATQAFSKDGSAYGAKKVLVVEDNKINQIVARETILKWAPAMEIDGAMNGKEALEKVKEHDYDLIVMDIQMPIMDGYEATRLIRQLPEPKGRVPIVAMTAFASPSDAQKALSYGMTDYISKPFDPKDLFRKLTKIFGPIEMPLDEDAPEPAVNGQMINLSYLDKVTEGEESLRLKLVDMLLEETPEEMKRMRALFKQKKWNQLGATAHKFKSSAVLFGIKDLSTDLKSLELNARKGENLERVSELLDKVARTCTRACKELRKQREDWIS